MPITAILQEPGSADLPRIYAAYRPIIFLVRATATGGGAAPPRVYCDIYFDGVFYKTLSATQYKKLNPTNSDWQFDISNSCQEYLKFNLPINGGTAIEMAPLATAAVFCQFRSSGYDVNGFLVPDGIAPKQRTGTRTPTAGNGFQSESFNVINAVLQHEDNQDLLTHLEYARPNNSFDDLAYPLTHRPNGYKVCKGDSDFYPFLYLGDKPLDKIRLSLTLKDGTTANGNYNVPQVCGSVVSDVTPVVLSSGDVQVSFDSAGAATVWEWSMNDGESWFAITSKHFTITINDQMVILITETGQEIVTENGQMIIPEGVLLYDEVRDVIVRPRCSNGAYGTPDSASFTVPSPSVCQIPEQFELVSQSYENGNITFAIKLPDGEDSFLFQWQFDYGGGYLTNPASLVVTEYAGPNYVWNAPEGFKNGQFVVRIKTKCGTDEYSSPAPTRTVPWTPPDNTVVVYISDIVAIDNVWKVTCTTLAALSDDILITGYFTGPATGGGMQTFAVTCFIESGQLTGVTNIPGAQTDGIARNSHITNISPNPTSNGKILKYT